MDEIKAIVKSMATEELKELVAFLEGVLTGRETSAVFSAALSAVATAKPRKRSACSICKQAGHRAPTCPQKGTSVATRGELASDSNHTRHTSVAMGRG